jgi:hypothetical protein
MNSIENQIRSLIVNSAKTRFDYISFAEYFKELNENIPEGILFQIIVNFADNEENEIIALKIMNSLIANGFLWEENQIFEFLSDKRVLLKIEISIAKMALDMLAANKEPIQVLGFVSKILK